MPARKVIEANETFTEANWVERAAGPSFEAARLGHQVAGSANLESLQTHTEANRADTEAMRSFSDARATFNLSRGDLQCVGGNLQRVRWHLQSVKNVFRCSQDEV